MFLPPFLHNVEKMRENTAAALSAIVGDVLQRVWDELDYRINLSSDTVGSY